MNEITLTIVGYLLMASPTKESVRHHLGARSPALSFSFPMPTSITKLYSARVGKKMLIKGSEEATHDVPKSLYDRSIRVDQKRPLEIDVLYENKK
jgi:hypothetical protein